MNMNVKDCRTDQVIYLGYGLDAPQPTYPDFADDGDGGTYIVLGPDEGLLPDEVEEFHSREEAEDFATSLAEMNEGLEFLVFKLVTSVIAEPAEAILTFHA